MPKEINFLYKNHRGEVAQRTCMAHSLQYLVAPGYGYQPGWFITGDVEGKGTRSFALANMVIEPDDYMRHPVTLFRF